MKLQSLVAMLLFTGMASAQSSCPTVTRTSLCPSCAIADCILLTTASAPCGCPTAPVPTTTISHPCGPPCPPAACQTATSVVTASPCCPTVTSTAAPPGCTPKPACVVPACIELVTVTWPCSCVPLGPVPTVTVEESDCSCRAGCAVRTEIQYLPCPLTQTP